MDSFSKTNNAFSADTLTGFLERIYLNILLFLIATVGIAYYAMFSGITNKLMLMLNSSRYGGNMGNIGMLIVAIVLMVCVAKLGAISQVSLVLGYTVAALIIAFTGVSLSVLFTFVPSNIIIGAAISTASICLGMTMFALTSKTNILAWYKVLFAALIGILVASVVNLFLHSGILGFIVSIISVIVFSIYIAYDTALAKDQFDNLDYSNDKQTYNAAVLLLALNLYLDIINLFENLIEIFYDLKNQVYKKRRNPLRAAPFYFALVMLSAFMHLVN